MVPKYISAENNIRRSYYPTKYISSKESISIALFGFKIECSIPFTLFLTIVGREHIYRRRAREVDNKYAQVETGSLYTYALRRKC